MVRHLMPMMKELGKPRISSYLPDEVVKPAWEDDGNWHNGAET